MLKRSIREGVKPPPDGLVGPDVLRLEFVWRVTGWFTEPPPWIGFPCERESYDGLMMIESAYLTFCRSDSFRHRQACCRPSPTAADNVFFDQRGCNRSEDLIFDGDSFFVTLETSCQRAAGRGYLPPGGAGSRTI